MNEKELDKLREDRARDDVQWVMSTEQGRRFVWRLLSYCGIYHDIGGHGEEAFKSIGKRQAGLYLLGITSDASENQIFEMMREAKNRNIEESIHERANESRDISIDTGAESYLGPGYSSEPGPAF